jgi:hypothetical protein
MPTLPPGYKTNNTDSNSAAKSEIRRDLRSGHLLQHVGEFLFRRFCC